MNSPTTTNTAAQTRNTHPYFLNVTSYFTCLLGVCIVFLTIRQSLLNKTQYFDPPERTKKISELRFSQRWVMQSNWHLFVFQYEVVLNPSTKKIRDQRISCVGYLWLICLFAANAYDTAFDCIGKRNLVFRAQTETFCKRSSESDQLLFCATSKRVPSAQELCWHHPKHAVYKRQEDGQQHQQNSVWKAWR